MFLNIFVLHMSYVIDMVSFSICWQLEQRLDRAGLLTDRLAIDENSDRKQGYVVSVAGRVYIAWLLFTHTSTRMLIDFNM